MISSTKIYDVVYLALRALGVVSLGDTVDAAIAQEALKLLNALRAEWSISSKSYRLYDKTFIATANVPNITLGTDGILVGDIPTRPHDIKQITIIYGQINYKIDIVPYEDYRQINIPNIYSLPQKAYIDQQFPIQNIYLFPGLATGYGIRVIGTEYMTEYEHITDPFIDPPEYFNAMYLALALRLAPLYGVDVSTSGLVPQAQSAFKHIKFKLINSQLKPLDSQMGSGFNMWTGRGN